MSVATRTIQDLVADEIGKRPAIFANPGSRAIVKVHHADCLPVEFTIAVRGEDYSCLLERVNSGSTPKLLAVYCVRLA